MAKKIDEKTMLENIENLRSELSETKGFLQTYMLDPDPDSRPAEDERLKTVVRLAGEMEDILAQLTGGVHTIISIPKTNGKVFLYTSKLSPLDDGTLRKHVLKEYIKDDKPELKTAENKAE